MMKCTKIAMATALTVVLGTASMVSMAGPHHDHGDKHKQHLIEKLELTSDQQAQLDVLKTNKKSQMEPLHAQMKELRKELRAASKGDDFDQARVRDLLHRQADLKADMMAQKNTHRQQFRAMLNEEQKAKLQAMRAEMKEKHKMHRKMKKDKSKES